MDRSRVHLIANTLLALLFFCAGMVLALLLFEQTWLRVLLGVVLFIASLYVAHRLAPYITGRQVETMLGDDPVCYCREREINPDFAESIEDIPEGYCGTCEICGEPGHARAHPRLPTTGAWCDEHWTDLNSYRIFTSGDFIQVIQVLFFLLLLGGVIMLVLRIVH